MTADAKTAATIVITAGVVAVLQFLAPGHGTISRQTNDVGAKLEEGSAELAKLQRLWDEEEKAESKADLVVRLSGYERFTILRARGKMAAQEEILEKTEFERILREFEHSSGSAIVAVSYIPFDGSVHTNTFWMLRTNGFSRVQFATERWGRRTLLPETMNPK